MEIFDTHIQTILSHIGSRKGQIVIHIAGGTASGKTSLTQQLQSHFGADNCHVVSMDDYYHGRSFNDEKNISFDHEESFNIPLLVQHISLLKSGENIEKPVYCMKKEAPITKEKISPKKILIIEGLYALHSDFASHADMSIFIESDSHVRFKRRVARDLERTLQTQEDIHARFQTAEKLYKERIIPTKKHAHLIIHN